VQVGFLTRWFFEPCVEPAPLCTTPFTFIENPHLVEACLSLGVFQAERFKL
jgi:hypothetical protein